MIEEKKIKTHKEEVKVPGLFVLFRKAHSVPNIDPPITPKGISPMNLAINTK